MRIFQIAELVYGSQRGRFFIIETIITSDGPRTRVCDGRWDTAMAAQDEADLREGRTADAGT